MSEAKAPAAARIVTTQPREKLVALEWPVEFDGITYEQVRVRRVTGEEVAAFIERLGAGEKRLMPPMVECPAEVYAALDDDDRFALDEACIDFLPRRFRESAGSILASTADTSLSSPAS